MANITEITSLTTPASGDVLYIVDVSDTTDNVAGSDKGITYANLLAGYQAEPAEGAFVDGDKTKLDGIETGADVTDATNVNAAGAVMESDFTPAYSIIAQQSGTGAPTMVNLSDSQLLGKTSGGNIEGQSATAVRTLLNVEDGADVTDVTNVTTALASITIDAHSGVDTDKSKTPADGDVLTFDGTDWNAETPASGGGNPYGADWVVASSGGDSTTLGGLTLSAGDVVYIQDSTTETGAVTISANSVKIIGKDPSVQVSLAGGAYRLTLSGSDIQIYNLKFNMADDIFWSGANGVMDNCNLVALHTNDALLQHTGNYGRFSNIYATTSETTARTQPLLQLQGNQSVYTNFVAEAQMNGTVDERGVYYLGATGGTYSNLVAKNNGTISSSTPAYFYILGSNSTLTNCLAYNNNNTYGLGFSNIGTGNTFSGCKAYLCSGKGFYDTGGRNTYSGCSSETSNNATIQFDIAASDVTLSGCYAEGFATTGGGVGFQLTGDDNVMSGCRSWNHTTGVNIVSGNRNTVGACALNGSGTALTDGGTGSITTGANST